MVRHQQSCLPMSEWSGTWTGALSTTMMVPSSYVDASYAAVFRRECTPTREPLRLYGGRGMWVRKPMLLTSDSTPLAFIVPNFRLYQIWPYAIRRLPRCWKCPKKAPVSHLVPRMADRSTFEFQSRAWNQILAAPFDCLAVAILGWGYFIASTEVQKLCHRTCDSVFLIASDGWWALTRRVPWRFSVLPCKSLFTITITRVLDIT